MKLNREQLKALAIKLADDVMAPMLITLSGPLGSGKTFFSSSFIERLTGLNATSPTYAIFNEYNSDKGKIVHIDAYRLKNETLDSLGVDLDSIILLEWPQNIKLEGVRKKLDITLNYLGEEREVHVISN